MMNELRNRMIPVLAGWVILGVISGCKPPEGPESQAKPQRKVSDVDPPKVDLSKEGPSDAEVPPDFQKNHSGLKYRILRKTNGDKPNEFSIATVSYRAWLDDGREFESTYERNMTNTLAMDKLIPGLREGITLLGEGGKIELEIPYQIGYGPKGLPPKIPEGATLHYIVELHSFK